ncbi:hypothetical protein HRbin17_02817 [bacterium HR17]|uniref:Uncharacterized protein n=1 Tax=Candidatus Fervidibacter japonicus TaxID=2035412 RepID=A0A2H5XGJ1_9BACT|nr:hypothetical protein HRbin17_02817 [bacterium HR17]
MCRGKPFSQVVMPAHRGIDADTFSAIFKVASVPVEEFMCPL